MDMDNNDIFENDLPDADRGDITQPARDLYGSMPAAPAEPVSPAAPATPAAPVTPATPAAPVEGNMPSAEYRVPMREAQYTAPYMPSSEPAPGYTPFAAPETHEAPASPYAEAHYAPPTGEGRPYAPAREGGIRTTYVKADGASGDDPFSMGARPSYGGYNGYRLHHEPMTPPEPEKPKKKKKSPGKKKGIALLIAACMAISFVCGAAGALVGSELFDKTERSDKSAATVKYSTDQKDIDSKVTDGTVAGAAAYAKDSVVEITTESMTTSTFFGNYVQSGAGSGVIIDGDKGYIITCAHVVDGATSITVRLSNGDSHEATLIGSDSRTDIAVISINATGLVSAKIGDSDKLVVGENAIAIGNPLGTLGGTVSSGIISALDREITIDGQSFTLLQIDTSINPGNSGGGLFDIGGNLIGVVNAKSSGSAGSGTTIEGLGFAIPINKAVDIAKQLIENGYVGGRVALGIYTVEVGTTTSQTELYMNGYGELIDHIDGYGVYFLEYTGGQNGDLKYGDHIMAIDGTSVITRNDIVSLLEEYSVGDTVKVTVSRLNSDRRRSQMVTVDVTLIESIPEQANEGNATDK